MKSEETGVFVQQSVFYFKNKVEDGPEQMEKMNELRYLPGFEHNCRLIEETCEYILKLLEHIILI